MKALFVSALTLFALASALSSGWDIMYRLAYSLFGVLLVSFVWSWASVRWLWFEHEVKSPRSQVGGRIQERLTLENSSWLPKLWLEIRDHSTLMGHRGNRVVTLGSFAKRAFDLETECWVRGVFRLGPITVMSGDPFGLFKRQRKLEVGGSVVVYPPIAELRTFGRLSGELPGGSSQTERTHYVTPNAVGIRDYQPGDVLSRIHWLSSARLQRLVVKEFDPDPMSDAWLILDLDSEVQAGTGRESTEEYAAAVCATLANYFIKDGREVGIITQGRVLPADRGDRQLHRVLELLAIAGADSDIPLELLVLSEENRFARGSTVVVITASTDERWLVSCRLLKAHGVNVLAVLLDARSFGGGSGLGAASESLAVLGVPTYSIRRGDDLGVALSAPGGLVTRT